MTMTTTADTYAAEMFSDAQIATAMDELADYERYDDVASLASGTYEADTLEAFAKLARTLKLPVMGEYSNLKIRRERPVARRRESALSNLRRQAERGEIEPAYLYGRD
jgi:hypothetical protein